MIRVVCDQRFAIDDRQVRVFERNLALGAVPGAPHVAVRYVT
jgi:hypothetical protein